MHGLEQQVLEVKILHIYYIQEPRNTLNIKYIHYLDSKWRENCQKFNLHSMRDISVGVIYFCSHIWVFRISVGTLYQRQQTNIYFLYSKQFFCAYPYPHTESNDNSLWRHSTDEFIIVQKAKTLFYMKIYCNNKNCDF